MRIAFAADGSDLESHTQPVLGRADWFVIVDDKGRLCEAFQNPYRDDQQGCGQKVASLLHEHGVGVVISGNRGPKAAQACDAHGLRTVFIRRDTVKNAAERYFALERELGPSK